MTICAECRHQSIVLPGFCNVDPVSLGFSYVSGHEETVPRMCSAKNTGNCPDFAPRGTTLDDLPTVVTDDEFRPNPDVEPLQFETFERGLVKPLFPLIRAWLRALWGRLPSSPEGGPR